MSLTSPFEIKDFPAELFQRENATLLNGILRGVERETLRVDNKARLSKKPHPSELGSAFAHPQITTDFSESLLEFITPPSHIVDDLFSHLDNIHRFVANNLDNELLWPASMPCVLGGEDGIPVAQYGSSNNAKMKTIYRKGLGRRYGRNMQTVAGIHYNFSLPNAFWAHFQQKENSLLSIEKYKNKRYFSMIRNFRRHFWLLILLFGASPTMCSSFVGSRSHTLKENKAKGTLYLPYATSLRMGDLGYQSTAQESLYVCYNDIQSYLWTLRNAIQQPYPAYESFGLHDSDGEQQQLNTGILQIENEFYSSIRPKRTAQPGETALTALNQRGIEYIEVRCLDVNPFSPLGIDRNQVHFLDTFLLYCALADSPDSDKDEFNKILSNQKKVVNQGRDPDLHLDHPALGSIPAQQWVQSLLQAMEPVAAALDSANATKAHSASLNNAFTISKDLTKSPSAKMLALLEDHDSYIDIAMSMAKEHTQSLKQRPLDAETLTRMQHMVDESLAQQNELERSSDESFESFLKEYYAQYDTLGEAAIDKRCS
ncbi:MAG: glutamate--cysteine ligase [Flavobacteriales bacterium]